jgi:uncharacterized protein YbbC (DUF1343 family)
MRIQKLLFLFLFLSGTNIAIAQLKAGAEQTDQYLPLLKGKKCGLVANHSSFIGQSHLVDTLLSLGVQISAIFSPEHGFKGNAANGAFISNEEHASIPVISLYGNKKKPDKKDLKGLDQMLFDIQDVGVRFYTYISTLTYIMEACAEAGIPLIVLDRPNPNGFYIDGPVLEPSYSSFVGLHPVPVVYGMTIGEYALMVNGELWLKNKMRCDLKIIPCKAYKHKYRIVLPVPPSPNLRSMEAVYLYPSLCFFEGTDVSVGRGTEHPFEVVGKPGFQGGTYSFTPRSIPGQSDHPKHQDILCKGFILIEFARDYLSGAGEIYLYWLTGFYDASDNKESFFNAFFDKLAGTSNLRLQIMAGKSVEEIKKSWQKDLEAFKEIRKKYLIYDD